MKKLIKLKILSAVCLLSLVVLTSCEENGSTVVGSDEGITIINRVSFTVTEREVSSSSLKASGRVKNTGTSKITSPFYVEGQFYEDSTLNLKLGGDNTQIGVPLEPGVETIWTLTFSDPDISEGNYPNFSVSNLRAFYRE